MYRAFIIDRELQRLRRRTESHREPLALELPMPEPYWHDKDREERDSESSRGVVIIDMNDYSEVETD